MIENFREKVEETINFLPPMPSIMMELIDALNNEDVDLRSLGKIISRDPAMVMNVLKIANSAFYGLPTKITNIEQAVRMLGTNEITSLCISCSASRSLKPPKGVETLNMKEFWRHSVATGVIGKILCNKLSMGRLESLYLAGLVHDVGKVVLDRFIHDAYRQIVELTYKENISILEAETMVVGASHDIVGGWLMERWRLPPIFGEVARYHHAVNETPDKSVVVVALINMADQLARLKGYGFGGDRNGVDFSITDAFKILQKKNRDLADLDVFKLVWDLDGAHEEIEEMERIVNR
ncbi:MAG TPA: HDOD domain-containing protein [Syntrophorhabdaceae bacterium]